MAISNFTLILSVLFQQVCPPGLHLTLGIFLRLFVLLESECHQLDLTMRLQGCDSGPSYERYFSALNDLTPLKDEQLVLKNGLQLLEQLFTHSVTTSAMSPTNPVFLELAAEIKKTKERLQQIVGFYSTIQYITNTRML